MVAIAIIAGLFTVGSFIDMGVINRRSISAEQLALVSILQKARNQAMSNIDHIEHGVHIDPDAYTLFEGTNYSPISLTNEIITKSGKTTISGLNDIYFAQLSGEPSTTGLITLNNGTVTKTINIINGGLIDW